MDADPPPLPHREPRPFPVHFLVDAAVAFLVLVLPALFAGVSLWWTAAAALLIGLAVAPLTQRQEVDGLARRDAARGTDGAPGGAADRDGRDGDDEIDLREPE